MEIVQIQPKSFDQIHFKFEIWGLGNKLFYIVSKVDCTANEELSLSIEGFVKITRIGTVMITDRQKLSEPYCDNTFMILESYWQEYVMLCWYQAISADTRFVMYCLVLLSQWGAVLSLRPGANVIKLITSVIYEFLY
jgi:hypothetical protein